jgi:uncharacterized cupredoxin-like copper-binding protein
MKCKIWKSIVPWCGLVAFMGCSSSPEPRQPEPPALLTQDEYTAQREAAILKHMVWNEDVQELEFGGRTLHVSLSDFKFVPSIIRFKSGTVIRIRLKNTGLQLHYFGGKEFFRRGADIVNIFGTKVPNQLNIPVPAFTTRDVYLFIKDPGEYPLSCFVPNHRADGMKGTLLVVP